MALLPVVSTNNADEVFRILLNEFRNVNNLAIACQAASVPLNQLASLLQVSINLNNHLATVQGNATLLAALVAHAQQITGSTTFQADLVTVKTDTQALITAIVTDYPIDASRHMLDRVLNADGTVSVVAVTQAQIPTTAPAITTWLAAVS